MVRVVIMNRSALPANATNKANSLNWQKQRKLVQLLKEGSEAPNLKNACMTNKHTNKKKKKNNNKCKREIKIEWVYHLDLDKLIYNLVVVV